MVIYKCDKSGCTNESANKNYFHPLEWMLFCGPHWMALFAWIGTPDDN